MHRLCLQVLVLLVTGGLLSMGVYGSINIVQRFDANKMLPADSYLSKWIAIQQEYYSGHGFAVSVNVEFWSKVMLPTASYPFAINIAFTLCYVFSYPFKCQGNDGLFTTGRFTKTGQNGERF